jgi:hypothetical protein
VATSSAVSIGDLIAPRAANSSHDPMIARPTAPSSAAISMNRLCG